MMKHRITILGSHDAELQTWLRGHPDGHERGAIVLFRRLSRPARGQNPSDRFIGVKVIKMTGDWVLSSSVRHLEINMRKFPEIYFQCEQEGLELGFIHSHADGHLGFSEIDDGNEKTILHGLSGCSGEKAFLVAMVLVGGNWTARIRQGIDPDKILEVRHVAVLGAGLKLHGIAGCDGATELLVRQAAAFGAPFNSMLQSLRVAVVGVGGTGSPVATLLARAGIGELILLDDDKLEASNMNRVRGYRDVDVGKYKAESLASFIEELGLDVSVSAITGRLGESSDSLDALSSADVIVGCTDDTCGRDIMNQATYYYAQAYIDCGLTGKVEEDAEGNPYLRDHRGRVSCVLPESGACLRCQGVVTEEKIVYEQAVKDKPELVDLDPETLEREYYLIGGGEQAPGVGPFTSATADNVVATLMDLIRPYRDIPTDLRRDNIWIDFIHMGIYSNEPEDDPECIYCRQQIMLLKKEDKFRLDMPLLGEF